MRTSHTGTTRTSAHGQRGIKISEEPFLPLLTAQIKHQDALKSVDSSDAVSQPAALPELAAFQETDSTQERSDRIPPLAESGQFLAFLNEQIKHQQLLEAKGSFDSVSPLVTLSRLSIYHNTSRAPRQCHSHPGSGIFDASWLNCDTIALQATTPPLEERYAEQFLKGGKWDADVIFLAAEKTDLHTSPLRAPAALDQALAWEAFMDDVYYPDPVSISINLSHAWTIGVWIPFYNPALPKRTDAKPKRRSSSSRLTEHWISSRHNSLAQDELPAGLAAQ
ncbi:hypothetical protein LZG37_03115 [Halomonas titanicae]|uniref:flagellar hook capping FlgD N-terminal domain-containing protein n=1 Tax=Vreelandella titanicae TaxID=664683 RepID=UPI001F1F6568|nr:flagellar hook capping FlgD N-terminal domain-containing protein [Halomonas titanicae]MCE7517115.1 hypothetical protein [Halomonas titanicae]